MMALSAAVIAGPEDDQGWVRLACAGLGNRCLEKSLRRKHIFSVLMPRLKTQTSLDTSTVVEANDGWSVWTEARDRC